ncbi:helix-turn-helix domain-containing protein [Desulfotomaculum copahuensis]|uniref:helix-turn-helix domain-containing protein n=1 Tax=Desulfotomaculum copahuensis TaxID=1838280 RepID=UPI000ABBEB5D|nr:helix-turn-helix domain-containing protein [Desulfotomaculum copahuensis]
MQEKPGLRVLVLRAKNGDREAFVQLILCIYPLLKKYSLQLGYIGACSDLVYWLLHAIANYQS